MALTFISLPCEHKHLRIQANLNTGAEYLSVALVGRNTKLGDALGDVYVKPYINCLYQLKNADTFKLVPVCEQARPLIESHLHFMEKTEKGPDFWA